MEILGAVFTGSLALLADGIHMLTDLSVLSLSLLVTVFSLRPPTFKRSYGYHRLEVLAGLASGLIVVLLVAFIFWQAYHRILVPREVLGLPMLAIAIGGLGVNLIGARILLPLRSKSLVVQGAFLNVLGDSLGSVSAIAAGVIIMTTGRYIADPIISMVIGVIILVPAFDLIRRTIDVLLESTPEHIDLDEVHKRMLSMKGVKEVHDLHAWTLTTGFVAMSGHVVVQPDLDRMEDYQSLLREIRQWLKREFNIDHATLQLETTTFASEDPRSSTKPPCEV